MKLASSPWTAAHWHNVFHDCQRQLLSYLRSKTASGDDAQELAQETWLRLAEAPITMPDGSQPTREAAKAYLFATAKHLAIDRMRQRQAQQRGLDKWAHVVDTNSHDVAEQAMYRQALIVVQQTIEGLPARTRSAFVGHRLQGEKQAAIAQRLDVSLNTIERDLMQADACLEAAMHRWRGSSSVERAARRRRRRTALSALLSLIVVSGACVPAWRYWRRRELWSTELASDVGQQRQRVLADSSEVLVDADSHVRLSYRADSRRAELLRGAAFFAVAHDGARPFTVQASRLRITVLGTRFGIELESSAVLVQVETGRVQVDDPVFGAQRELTDGQSLRISLDEADAADWSTQRSERPAAWRDGELVFDQQPLARLIARIQRYTRHTIEVDEDASSLRISGHLRIARLDGWLHRLPQLVPVRIDALSEGRLRIVRR